MTANVNHSWARSYINYLTRGLSDQLEILKHFFYLTRVHSFLSWWSAWPLILFSMGGSFFVVFVTFLGYVSGSGLQRITNLSN